MVVNFSQLLAEEYAGKLANTQTNMSLIPSRAL